MAKLPDATGSQTMTYSFPTYDADIMAVPTRRRLLLALHEISGIALEMLPQAMTEWPNAVKEVEYSRWKTMLRRRSHEFARQVHERPDRLLDACANAAHQWATDIVRDDNGPITRISQNLHELDRAMAIVRALPAKAFQGRPPHKTIGDRTLMAEALVHQRPVLVSANRRFITHAEIEVWINERTSAGELPPSTDLQVISIEQAMNDYIAAQPSLHAACHTLTVAALGACMPSNPNLDPVGPLAGFASSTQHVGMGHVVGQLKEWLDVQTNADAIIGEARNQLPRRTRTLEDERLRKINAAARNAGWQR